MPLIKTVAEFRQALENGPYAWPGGYPLYFICADGEALSFDAAQGNKAEIESAIEGDDWNKDWRIVGIDINYEDPALYCAHTNKRIESAYAEDEVEAQ